MKPAPALLYVVLTLLLVTCFALSLFVGNVAIPFSDVLKALFTGEADNGEWLTIIREFRLPKALTAVMAGSALSVSGLQMQTVFRNPLAGPFVLGISAGATLGVALVMMGMSIVGLTGITSNWTVVVAACLGAGTVLLLIFSVSLRIKDVMTILILGIMFGSITSSLINVLQYFSSESLLKYFTVWMMGSLQSVTFSQLEALMPSVFFGLLLALFSVKSLNAWLLGENYARSLGVNVVRSRLLIFCSTGILAGSVTAFCGPIGFIGIAVPHFCRMLFRTADQRILFAACILTGAIVMLVSDLISTLPGNGIVLPINSVTAFIGIPVVIWIIISNRRMSSLI